LNVASETMAQPVATSRRGIWGWMLFDWAQQPFHTLIITFVFAPYFAASVAPDAARGQELWGLATGIGGLLIALSSPVLGAIADASGPRKPWIFGFSIIGVIACAALWFATPGMANLGPVLIAVALAVFGMEFAAVFNNAMMPTLVPRAELGRLSGSAWGLGYVGGLLSLILVLGFMSVPDSFASWAAINGCTGDPKVTFEHGDVTCETFESCDAGVEVTLCTIAWDAHCWPGNPICPLGKSTTNIHASVAGAEFFARWSL
jgi:MFS-type transporter involved in bile tolerance (Atg22 family)